jgi:hypothetical protein
MSKSCQQNNIPGNSSPGNSSTDWWKLTMCLRLLITSKSCCQGQLFLNGRWPAFAMRAQARVWSLLVHGLSAETTAKLEALLRNPCGGHVSVLDRLRKGPFLRRAPEFDRAFRRADAVRELGINLSMSRQIPLTRIHALARFATTPERA